MSSSSGNIQDSKFFLETDDVLGFSYQSYLSSIRGHSLAKPSEYYQMRAAVTQSVISEAVRNLYTTIFQILKNGRKFDGGVIANSHGFGTGNFVPNFPSHKINDYNIEISSILGDALNKIIDILLPDDFTKLASAKLSIQGKSASIDV